MCGECNNMEATWNLELISHNSLVLQIYINGKQEQVISVSINIIINMWHVLAPLADSIWSI
jgi:hypothetical protein